MCDPGDVCFFVSPPLLCYLQCLLCGVFPRVCPRTGTRSAPRTGSSGSRASSSSAPTPPGPGAITPQLQRGGGNFSTYKLGRENFGAYVFGRKYLVVNIFLSSLWIGESQIMCPRYHIWVENRDPRWGALYSGGTLFSLCLPCPSREWVHYSGGGFLFNGILFYLFNPSSGISRGSMGR